MKTYNYLLPGFLLFLLIFSACTEKQVTNPLIASETIIASEMPSEENSKMFIETMQTHLDAVTNRDLETLKQTLSPNGNMQLILPGTETTNTVDEFMQYHKDWFASPNWTFETKILNTEIGTEMGMAVTEIVYREPLRDGKPYFNRMIVSYDLKMINGKWFVIKDHASSVEKSTDKK
ncbi:YybH family protein [Ulvibacter antarcticus]|uniref:SnoaL-like domain-containing protein n=1 Tax=Ulvibacter antarcticus TaxID=442714 RepID=A0A3L9YVT4_9FLAO|nr:nuclear transport factor 2 family protein [Ulvibacter antarcticus]RMA64861.1 hypothetical protein BXY75_1746 [Ulvibacter antarcticus]